MTNTSSALSISVGKSRKETSWKNQDVSWEYLINKLSTTHRTAETLAEYKQSPKSRQDEIKDVGGFVGGIINGGRRKKGSIVSRSVLTLDIDHCGKNDPWFSFTMLYEYAACVYSTHKHEPDNKRLRLVIPLDREVSCEEYVAISRKLAGNIGIDLFDDTTFQPHRLMYWPSTSKDGEFVFNSQEGPALSADGVLAEYHDWKDVSQWPVSLRVSDVAVSEAKKQGDPLEKPGLIGAFNNMYSIHEAIGSFIPNSYVKCDIPDRYTYAKGSTSAGVITYEDKFLYSHHETDPTSGQLCNAFDLIRIHLFGHEDSEVNPRTPINKRPSFKLMSQLASGDAMVRKYIGEKRLVAALEDFGGDIQAVGDGLENKKTKPNTPILEEVTDNDWLAMLEVNTKGDYLATIDNIMLIMTNDPLLADRFTKDVFERKDVVLYDTPWRKVKKGGEVLEDRDDSGLRHYLEKVYNISHNSKVDDALKMILSRDSYHPVKDYLDRLKWDGEKRAEQILVKFLAAENNEYVTTVTRKWLTAAVARIYRPGIKFDYVLTLVGPEGIKKSSLLKRLGGAWFSDSFNTVVGKEAYEQIQGVWIVEMGELAGLKKAEVESVKLFISKKQDRYRPAFGKRVVEYKRQCVFAATTNEWDFLKSNNGNRRFWPVAVDEGKYCVFDDLSQYEIDQIWAEAKAWFESGESLWLEDMEYMAKQVQEDHTEADSREGIIEQYANMLIPADWYDMSVPDRRTYLLEDDSMRKKGEMQRKHISAAEVWCELMGKQKGEMTRYNTREINALLRNLKDFDSKTKLKRIEGYGIQRIYERKGMGLV